MITNINGYLGFTDNTKEPRKSKVEKSLSKLYKIDGVIYNTVTFLTDKLIEGYLPEKVEGYQCYKRNGELTNPKTLYKLISKNKDYYEMSKTEYDFVCYLVDNDLTNESTINQYLENEKVRLEVQTARVAEEERIAKEREEAERKETERIKDMLQNDLQYISYEEKTIVADIFFKIYGEVHEWNYSILPLIHNFDLPYCKNEIKSRLYNDNKASIKIFERITGLKLPKGHKDRIKYLDVITSADFKPLKL